MSRVTVRIAAFTALAAFASFHWFALIAEPPLWRWLAVVGIAAALAVALAAATRVQGRAAAQLPALGLAALAALAGVAVTGVPVAQLVPGGWSELAANLDAGLNGVSQVELPYAGGDEWTRLGILAAAPLALALAAALAFWPRSAGRSGWTPAALVVLVALYGFAVTWEAPGAELARGLPLLALIGAFVWLPRLPARRALAGALALALAGAVALPVAARVEADEPLVDYRDWSLFGDRREVKFDWSHEYGPFAWPQHGTTLFEVRADRPLLWRTTVLDSFDGSRWLRGATPGAPEVPARLAGVAPALAEARRDRGWRPIVGVEVRALHSSLLIGAGTTLQVDGIETGPIDHDGTTTLTADPLTEGDSYSVTSYSPKPTRRELRRADAPYPRALRRYTALTLPYGTEQLGSAGPIAPLVPLVAPLRGSRQAGVSDPVGDAVQGTAYEPVLTLTRELTADARTSFAAVSAVERHLRTEYRYDQSVPEHRDPLPAFLFEDRRGYCQQFSGAMALMLRMAGIPSRVATGFAPGYRSAGENVYSVRDTDAHSWVEVWFRGIGWVSFDPTPGAAPAQAQSLAAVSAAGGIARFGAGRALSIEQAAEAGPAGNRARQTRSEGGPRLGGAVVGALLALAAALGTLTGVRRRRLGRPEGAGPQLAEVARALPALGYPTGSRTLLQMERLLAARAGRGAARYVAKLRANRYTADRPRRPGPQERRVLRRALAKGSPHAAPRAAWRAWRAVPPGGPRR